MRRRIRDLTRGSDDPKDFFVATLALGVAKLAAPHHPHPVLVRKVREMIGLIDVVVMVPFCRTPEEADCVLAVMAGNGLVRGTDGLEMA